MLVAARNFISKMFTTTPSASHLGRWSLKHDPKICENYLVNLYAEPGYPNTAKPQWILNQKDNILELKESLHSEPHGKLHSSNTTINSKHPPSGDV